MQVLGTKMQVDLFGELDLPSVLLKLGRRQISIT
jgi:hypothetical protein